MAIRKLQGPKELNEGVYYEFDTESDILGEGGMGRVYLGRKVDRNGGETPVAIKAMFEGLPELVIERARREASIQLYNDSLIHMYSFIETVDKDILGADVAHYHVISEYLDGISLADFIDGNLKDREGIVHPNIGKLYNEYIADREQKSTEIIKLVLSGVMALHDVGYIHRDIDPTNIMVTSDGKVKLIDFGVAKKLIRLSTADKGLTSLGQFLGKAGYAAPELILGDIHHQNYSTDVYAIGILYYQLLTGHLPFKGTNYEMIESQLRKVTPLRGIHSYQIKKVIKKATEKKQTERYRTSAQFRAEIDAFVFPEPWFRKPVVMKVLPFVVSIFIISLVFGTISKFKPGSEQSQEELYEIYLSDLNSQSSDKTQLGFNGMCKLAKKGYLPAMYQVAYTYAWIPKDSISSLRKKHLGLKTNSLGLLIDNSKNEEAIGWMKKVIQSSDSTNYQTMSWLAQYYLNGMVVNRDIKKAVLLLNQSKKEAIKNFDEEYIEKINKVLLRIKKMKHGNE